ncbi:MAG: hypothetical protein RBQ97_09085 [Acholeplasma sp.]|nr:hypothetical protein [Acholeplasma sp.]
MIKKFFIIIIAVVFIGLKSVSTFAANPIGYGIEVDENVWGTHIAYDSNKVEVKVDNLDKYRVGYATTDAFVYKLLGQENDDVDYYLVAYRVSVNPTVSAKKYNWFYNYYGWSEALYIRGSYQDGDSITDYSPLTDNPSASYSAGISFSVSPDGPEFSASSGISITENALQIRATQSDTNRLLEIKYDYMCDIAHSKGYLTSNTIQYGMYVVEHQKGTPFTTTLTTEMWFAPAIGWSNFTQVAVTYRVSDSISMTFTI